MLFGYPERIDLELYKVVPPRIEPIKIIAPPDRRHLAWLGGSILTSLTTFKDNWISQREYNECGASVVHR
jgi:actin-related protein